MKSFFITIPLFFLLLCCTIATDRKTKNTSTNTTTTLVKKSPKFNDYWYKGNAEITSYNLTQVRYGELHKGKAVTIFVTEDFLPKKQVKADAINKNNIPILKLNSTKKFVTGIYPYSIMTSTFSPIKLNRNALKISFSSQEWCGNTFIQLNNRNQFKINFHSYFESNSDKKINLKKNILENELWNKLRINPKSLPIGNVRIIPSFEFLALHHQKIKAYKATTTIHEKDTLLEYIISYPDLSRTLKIRFTKEFPFTIENWEETISSRGKTLTTTATKIKTIKSAYWNKNKVFDKNLRNKLGL